MSVELPDAFVDALADRIAGVLAARMPAAEQASPWMQKAQAMEYTQLEKGTFEKLAASGAIPSHGSPRVRLFHRAEIDAAIMRDYAPAPRPTELRRAS